MVHAHVIIRKEEDVFMPLLCQESSHCITALKILQTDIGYLFFSIIIVNTHKGDLTFLTQFQVFL